MVPVHSMNIAQGTEIPPTIADRIFRLSPSNCDVMTGTTF